MAFLLDPKGKGSVSSICCPACQSNNWEGRSGQYGIQRTCRECGESWSGGLATVVDPDSLPINREAFRSMVSGAPLPEQAPELDLPEDHDAFATPEWRRGWDE